MIESLDQLHSAVKELLVRDSLSCPTLEDFVDPITLFAAEFLVRDICVMNNLRDDLYPSVANPEVLLQRLERAVFAAVPKTVLVKHVERNRLPRHLVFRREGKPGLGIDEAPNQPGRCASVYTWPRSGYPNPLFVFPRINLLSL